MTILIVLYRRIPPYLLSDRIPLDYFRRRRNIQLDDDDDDEEEAAAAYESDRE